MDPLTRLEVQTLLGELLTEQRPVEEIERRLYQIIGDEKNRSYNIGLSDRSRYRD